MGSPEPDAVTDDAVAEAPAPVSAAAPGAAGAGRAAQSSGRGAFLVAAGIFASRVMGLVRERVFSHYFGYSMAAGAFKAALRIPNLLQNLFGEGALSASFIPVYASLIGKSDRDEADRVASAVFGLLSLAMAILVALGMLATPLIIDLIVPGFVGEQRELSMLLVRILFPGSGLLVISAWCLGVLNSHRRFFLSYVSPVIWNATIIVALVLWGRSAALPALAEYSAYAAVAGSLFQFLAQLPPVLGLLGRFRPTLDVARESVRQVLHGFLPVLIGRGVVQLSAYVDQVYTSWIPGRAPAALPNAQILYLLPVSLFGMAVSAAELPEMSQVEGDREEVALRLRARVGQAVGRIAFFVVPSSIALLLLGDVAGAALFQTGKLSGGDARYLWYILAGAAIGLLATTTARLYSSAFYATKDTRTPLRFAIVRVLLSAVLAYPAALVLPRALGWPEELGAVGITLVSSVSAWTERTLLKRALQERIGALAPANIQRLYAAAIVAGLAAFGVKLALARVFGPMPGLDAEWGGTIFPPPNLHPVLAAIAVLGVFGVLYFGVGMLLGIPEARGVLRRLKRR